MSKSSIKAIDYVLWPPASPALSVSSPKTFDAAMNLQRPSVTCFLVPIGHTYIPPAYPPKPRMLSACTEVMRSRFSMSLTLAVNWASCA